MSTPAGKLCQYKVLPREAVNYVLSFPRVRCPPARLAALAWLLGGLLVTAPAAAQRRPLPPLLRGDPTPPKPIVVVDPSLPTGSPRRFEPRPSALERPACGARAPVCVHRGAAVPTARALELLSALELGYERLFEVLELPAPRGDEGRGGSDAVDVYLELGGPSALELRLDEPPPYRPFDSTSGACVVGSSLRGGPSRAATQCLVELALLGVDPGEPAALRRALSTQLWWALGAPGPADLQAVDAQQRAPEQGLAPRDCGSTDACEGGALLFEFLEWRYGSAAPGALGFALFSAAGSRTPAAAWQWHDEPDVFDVLRHSVGESKRAAAEMALGLAVARAFIGDRDDGTQLPSLGWAGRWGRPRIDWSIAASSLPRRVAASRPLEPYGAYYLLVSLDGPAPRPDLGFRAEWEQPAAFAWTLLSLAGDGRLLARRDVPFQQNASEVEASLVPVEDARYLLVVGTTLEGIGASHPFDPDVWPYEPRGLTVYLAHLPPP